MKKIITLSFLFLVISSLTLSASNLEKPFDAGTVSVKEILPFTYCCIHHKGPFTDIEKVIGTLIEAMRNQNIFPTGPMIGIYYNTPEEVNPEELEWDIGFPITPQNRVQAPLEKKQWSFTTVASALHTGPYEKTAESLPKIFEWMQKNNYIPLGPVVERYLDQNPSQIKPEELRTEIWIPCKKTKK